MSAATEFAPAGYLPLRARPGAQRTATIIVLHSPGAGSRAADVRLTRRGMTVLAMAVAALATGLVWVAWLSAPSGGAGRARPPATVTVNSGDTLWSIATRVAPDRDPRAEVAELQERNHLGGVELVAGQVLRTR